MWFAREAAGFRAWFTVQDKNGNIRTGIPSGQMTATIVDPADAASLVPTVTESATKPGLYTFLVTSAFLTTNGTGGYGVVVEINAAAAPKVDAVLSKVLEVYEFDFDSIATLSGVLSYAGVIYIDTKNGTPGTTVGVNGTPGNPVDTLADAVTLATATGFRKYQLIGSVTLTSAHDDWVIVGGAAEAAVSLGGQDVADSLFQNCQLSGNIGTGPIQAIDCDIDGVGNFTGDARNCSLVNGTTLGAGTVSLHHCFSDVPGLGTPSLDLDGVASLNLRAYSGGIEIQNMTAGGQNASLEFVAGQAIIAASNTAGTITLRGIGNLTDSSAGTTIERNAFLNIDAIWDEIQDGAVTARDIMTRVNAFAVGRITLSGAVVKPAQNAVYYDESGAPLYTNRNTGTERNPVP